MSHTDHLPLRLIALVRGRLVVPVASVHLLCFVPSVAQKMSSTLGPVTDLELSYTPADITTLRVAKPQATEIAVLERAPARVHLYTLARTGELQAGSMVLLGSASSAMLAADLTGDGTDEFLTLSPDLPALAIHRRNPTGFTSTSIPLSAVPEHMTAADINNDRRLDILLYGRSMSGVQVMNGNGRGSLATGPLMFPDISVSDLGTDDLNGDNIADVILADWLADRVTTFYGIGRGVFSEQVAVDVGTEPSRIALTHPTRARTFVVAVSLPAQGTIAVYEGNATGELDLRQSLMLDGPVNDLLVTQLTSDAFPELLVLTNSTIAVSTGLSSSTFSAPVVFGPGRELGGAVAADLDGDRLPDVATVDRTSRRLVVLGNSSSRTPWPSVYAVGSDPHGLAVHDLDGDGQADIAVADRGSARLSILRGKGDGRFEGQETIEVPAQPVFLTSTAPTGKPVRTLITSHEAGDMVTIIRFGAGPQNAVTASIPTGARPVVLLAREDSTRGTFEMLVRYEHGKDRSLSLSLFERAGGRQFVERSLRPGAAGKVVALTVDQVLRNGSYDLVFVTHDQSAARSSLSVATAGAGFDFRTVHQVLAYGDSAAATQSVITGFVNRDDHKDVLLLLGTPRNAIGVLYGRGERTFRDSLEWIRGVRPGDDNTVVLRDLDFDGATDLVCLDQLRSAVVVAYQRMEGGFRPPVVAVAAQGATGMCIASLRSPGEHDLILSRADHGTVSITFNAFRK